MFDTVVYADLKRIIKKLRCNGMSEADVIFEVAEILKYRLCDDAFGVDFE